jgi:hypothetical protein
MQDPLGRVLSKVAIGKALLGVGTDGGVTEEGKLCRHKVQADRVEKDFDMFM